MGKLFGKRPAEKQIEAAMPPQRRTLHGIHKRPAARARMSQLLRKRPARGQLVLRRGGAENIHEHWPVFGCPGYSLVKLPDPISWNEFSKIGFEIRSKLVGKRRDRAPWGKELGYYRAPKSTLIIGFFFFWPHPSSF